MTSPQTLPSGFPEWRYQKCLHPSRRLQCYMNRDRKTLLSRQSSGAQNHSSQEISVQNSCCHPQKFFKNNNKEISVHIPWVHWVQVEAFSAQLFPLLWGETPNDKGKDTRTTMKHVLQDGSLSQHYNPHRKYKVSNNPPAFLWPPLTAAEGWMQPGKRYKLWITRHQTSTSLLGQPLAPLVTTSRPAGPSHTYHCYQQAIPLPTLSANFSCSCKLWTFFNKYSWHGVQVTWHSMDSLLRVYFGRIPTSDSGKKQPRRCIYKANYSTLI